MGRGSFLKVIDKSAIKGEKMDLGAYVKIKDLSQIMINNGIEIPRLRGLRLMSEEKIKDQIVFL